MKITLTTPAPKLESPKEFTFPCLVRHKQARDVIVMLIGKKADYDAIVINHPDYKRGQVTYDAWDNNFNNWELLPPGTKIEFVQE